MKTAEEFLKESFLLVDDGRTCEAHTYLVTDQMRFFAKMHVEAALKAKVKDMENYYNDGYSLGELDAFTRNCYPLKNIE